MRKIIKRDKSLAKFKIYAKEEKYMAQKNLKKFAPLLSFLLVFSILLSPLLSISGSDAVSASNAFVEGNADFDYASVMSEPKTENVLSIQTSALTRQQLKNVKLYPGGVPFGVKFMTEGILIVGFSQSSENPMIKAGLKINDRILSLEGKTLSSAQELTQIIKSCNGKTLSVTYLRNGEKRHTKITPIYSNDEGC